VQVLRKLVVGDGIVMNDGATDPQGRFWIGEMDMPALGRVLGGGELEKEQRKARLWRFNGKTGKCEIADHGLIFVNGVGWSPDGKSSKS
jgi:sugar lactone lactonase YvrE